MKKPVYPVVLKLSGEPCLVIGGGRVAERKVHSLLDAGARVTVISPDLTPGLNDEVQRGHLSYVARCYRPGDVDGYFMVISATNDGQVNAAVARDCRARRILLNAVDDPVHCSFFVPASVRRGDLVISVSTSGKSPLLARRIREGLEQQFGPVYGEFLDFLAAWRAKVISEESDQLSRQQRMEARLTSDVLSALQQGDLRRAKELIGGC